MPSEELKNYLREQMLSWNIPNGYFIEKSWNDFCLQYVVREYPDNIKFDVVFCRIFKEYKENPFLWEVFKAVNLPDP